MFVTEFHNIHSCSQIFHHVVISESETSERAGKPPLHIRGFAIVQTTRDDIYAMQSQLWDRQSGVGIEPLTFELETEEPKTP